MYKYFSTFSPKRHDFRKEKKKKKGGTRNKVWNFISSTNFVCNISHSKKKWARYDKKLILVVIWSTRYSCPSWMKLAFSRHIFEKKCSNIKFHDNQSCGSRVFPCGQTDGHDEANSRLVSISSPSVITHCNSEALISLVAGKQKRFAIMNHKLNTEQRHHC